MKQRANRNIEIIDIDNAAFDNPTISKTMIIIKKKQETAVNIRNAIFNFLKSVLKSTSGMFTPPKQIPY